MKRLFILGLAVMMVLTMTVAAAAWGGPPYKPPVCPIDDPECRLEVPVKVTIEPYCEVTVDPGELEVTLMAGQDGAEAQIGFQVKSNFTGLQLKFESDGGNLADMARDDSPPFRLVRYNVQGSNITVPNQFWGFAGQYFWVEGSSLFSTQSPTGIGNGILRVMVGDDVDGPYSADWFDFLAGEYNDTITITVDKI